MVVKFKLEKQREKETTTYVKTIQRAVIIYLGTSLKKEIWTPEEVKEEGSTTTKRARKTTKTATKRTTVKKTATKKKTAKTTTKETNKKSTGKKKE